MTSQYQCISIPVTEESTREQLIAELAAAGYEGFEELESSLQAYLSGDEFDVNALKEILSKYNLTYSQSTIEKQNWNTVWESNFEPVLVDDFVGVRAAFHPPITSVQHEIVITPKMSFGTGHHATTYLVMQLMRGIGFGGKTVFDFGTGTGILAILAAKLGAKAILAVDNDDWCIENARENTLVNDVQHVVIEKVSDAKMNQRFNIVIANINKNIILDNLQYMAEDLETGGDVLLSGLLKEDEADIREACSKMGWVHQTTLEHKGWIACWFR